MRNFSKFIEQAKTKEEPVDNISKLEKLAELKEKGVLSEEEFQQEKKKILD